MAKKKKKSAAKRAADLKKKAQKKAKAQSKKVRARAKKFAQQLNKKIEKLAHASVSSKPALVAGTAAHAPAKPRHVPERRLSQCRGSKYMERRKCMTAIKITLTEPDAINILGICSGFKKEEAGMFWQIIRERVQEKINNDLQECIRTLGYSINKELEVPEDDDLLFS